MTLGGLAMMKEIGAALEDRAGGRQEMTGAAPATLTGATINRLPAGGGDTSAQQFESCVVLLSVQSLIAVGQSVSLAIDPEHADADLSADPTGETAGAFSNVPATHQPSVASAAQVIAGTAAARQDVLRYDLRLVELKKFVRFNIVPTFSGGAGAGDIVREQEVVMLGGAHKVATRDEDWVPDYKTL